MGNTIGINWYARLQAKIANLEHKLEDVQAYNKELNRKLNKYENNNIGSTGNRQNNNVVELSGRIYKNRN
jgi:hypothetical protein